MSITLNDITSRLSNVKKTGSGIIAQCPSHNDTHNSLSVTQGDDKILVHCHANCTFDEICNSLNIEVKELFSDANGNGFAGRSQPQRRIVKTYDYFDASGKLLYQNVRYEPKDFRQRRPNGHDGWVWNLQSVSKIPYPAIVSVCSNDYSKGV